MNDLTINEAKTWVAKATEWLKTPEGQQAIKESIARTKETIERLEEARRYKGNEI